MSSADAEVRFQQGWVAAVDDRQLVQVERWMLRVRYVPSPVALVIGAGFAFLCSRSGQLFLGLGLAAAWVALTLWFNHFLIVEVEAKDGMLRVGYLNHRQRIFDPIDLSVEDESAWRHLFLSGIPLLGERRRFVGAFYPSLEPADLRLLTAVLHQ